MAQSKTPTATSASAKSETNAEQEPTLTSGVGHVVTLTDALKEIGDHPLFNGIGFPPNSTSPYHAFRVDYKFGEPIVIGEPTFSSSSSPSSKRRPGIQPPKLQGVHESNANAWQECVSHNPLFVIKSGFVEVHHPCTTEEESVPRAMLCGNDYFGEYEMQFGKSMNYRFSATAGFRTVVCWRELLTKKNEVLSADFLRGFYDDPKMLAHRAWEFAVLSKERAGVTTVLYIIPQEAFKAIAYQQPQLWERFWSLHIRRTTITAALSEEIRDSDGGATNARSDGIRTAKKRGVRIKHDFALRAVAYCTKGVLPHLVPLAAYRNFSDWDLEFNLRIVSSRGSNRNMSVTAGKYPGACLFFVPCLESQNDNTLVSTDCITLQRQKMRIELPLGEWRKCLTRKMLATYACYHAVNVDKMNSLQTANPFENSLFQMKGSFLRPPCVEDYVPIEDAVDKAFSSSLGLARGPNQKFGSPRDDLFFLR